jgi:hypothetical protein
MKTLSGERELTDFVKPALDILFEWINELECRDPEQRSAYERETLLTLHDMVARLRLHALDVIRRELDQRGLLGDPTLRQDLEEMRHERNAEAHPERRD